MCRLRLFNIKLTEGQTINSCDPALLVLVMLVSRNVFPVVSAVQSISLKQKTSPQSYKAQLKIPAYPGIA